MCSSPRPKHKVAVKVSNASVSILSSISNEKRRHFALLANQASERRIEMQKLKTIENERLNNTHYKYGTKKKAKTVSSWLYNLFNASVSDIANKITSKLFSAKPL